MQTAAETSPGRHTWERIDDADALDFWGDSPQATTFTHPAVLRALAGTVDWWLCRKGDTPICLWPVAADWFRKRLPAPWIMYVGPMWSASAWCMPAHRWLSESERVYSGFLSRLMDAYGHIHAQLAPGLSDVRAFQWWRSSGSEAACLRVYPQYSAVLPDVQRSDSEILAAWRPLRRRELRRAELLQPRLRSRLDLDELQRLYQRVFERQNCTIPADQLGSLESLLALAGSGHGSTFAIEVRGALAFAGLLLYDRTGAHMVVNVIADEFRGSGLNAWATLEMIRAARRLGCRTFDFDGANSPNRGDDKHSYGAFPVLYFELAADNGRER